MLLEANPAKQNRQIATRINALVVVPNKQEEVVASLAAVTERTMRHLPGVIGTHIPKSADGEYTVNGMQRESAADGTAPSRSVASKPS